jgi:hypothetical protein
LSLGMEVRVKYIRWGITSFNDATIQKVNEDETFDVVFDEDDETRKNVPLNEIQIPNVSHSFSSCYLFHVLYVGTLFVLLTHFFFFFSDLSLLLSSFFSLLSFLFFLFSFHIIIYIGGKFIGKRESVRRKVCQICFDKGRYL